MHKYHIITYGCQMNINESERVARFLEEQELQSAPLASADTVFFNSCSIRQSAIDRLKAKARKIKKENPNTTLVLIGCVLEKDKEKMTPLFDHILNTKNISSWNLPLPETKTTKDFFAITPKRKKPTAYVSIMTGCNNFCSYCVVPYTKGREKSRPTEDILQEVREAISQDYKEIFLLGQNVNSYKGEYSFAKLLQTIDSLEGDFWIRFATSHPKDFSDDLIKVLKYSKKIARHIHLPLQSGDNEILKKMNRPYTAKEYIATVEKIKKEVPTATLSTDIIVGFPGEKEKSFHHTCQLVSSVDFTTAYIARYSKRASTAAFHMKETVSTEKKKEREKKLTSLIERKNTYNNKKKIGKELTVLIFSTNKKGDLIGKTESNITVLTKGPKELINSFAKVKITSTSAWGMKGKIVKK